MRIVFTEPDDVRIKFEAACHRVGSGMASQAFSRLIGPAEQGFFVPSDVCGRVEELGVGRIGP